MSRYGGTSAEKLASRVVSIFGRGRKPEHQANVVYVYTKNGDKPPYYSAVCRCGWFAEPVDTSYPDPAVEQQADRVLDQGPSSELETLSNASAAMNSPPTAPRLPRTIPLAHADRLLDPDGGMVAESMRIPRTVLGSGINGYPLCA